MKTLPLALLFCVLAFFSNSCRNDKAEDMATPSYYSYAGNYTYIDSVFSINGGAFLYRQVDVPFSVEADRNGMTFQGLFADTVITTILPSGNNMTLMYVDLSGLPRENVVPLEQGKVYPHYWSNDLIGIHDAKAFLNKDGTILLLFTINNHLNKLYSSQKL